MTAVDRLEEQIDRLADDRTIELPVRLLRDVVREVTDLESRLDFARAFVPEDLELP